MKLHHILYRDFGLSLGKVYNIHDEYGLIVLNDVYVDLQGEKEDTEISLHYAETGELVKDYNSILAMLDAGYFYAKRVLGVEIRRNNE